MAAHMLGVYAGGWVLFCHRAGLHPTAGAGLVKWEETADRAQEETAAMRVTKAEADAIAASDDWQEDVDGESPLKTSASVAADL